MGFPHEHAPRLVTAVRFPVTWGLARLLACSTETRDEQTAGSTATRTAGESSTTADSKKFDVCEASDDAFLDESVGSIDLTGSSMVPEG